MPGAVKQGSFPFLQRPRTRLWRTDEVLFHGTLKRNERSIRKLGLYPSLGAVVENAYDEYRPGEIPELVYAADYEHLDSALTAAQMQISHAKGCRYFHDVTEAEFWKKAMIVVVPRAGFTQATQHAVDYGHTPPGVEPADWYTDGGVAPLAFLTGQRLRLFVEQKEAWRRRIGLTRHLDVPEGTAIPRRVRANPGQDISDRLREAPGPTGATWFREEPMPARRRRTAAARTNPATGLHPPQAVVAAFARGLDLLRAGHGGRGLRPETVAWARRIVRGAPVTPAKLRLMRAWFARHGASPLEVARRRRDPTSPAAVAWALWGGDAGRAWARREADRMDRSGR
jgi:hypothetical protein